MGFAEYEPIVIDSNPPPPPPPPPPLPSNSLPRYSAKINNLKSKEDAELSILLRKERNRVKKSKKCFWGCLCVHPLFVVVSSALTLVSAAAIFVAWFYTTFDRSLSPNALWKE